jgi:hypothetical protein
MIDLLPMRVTLAVLLFASTAAASSGTFVPSADTFVILTNGTHVVSGNNFGGSGFIFIGRDGLGGVARGVIRFDLSALTGHAVVTGAQLTLTSTAIGDQIPPTGVPIAMNVSLRPFAVSWTEGTQANDVSMGFMVSSACAGGGASWDSPNCNGSTWGAFPGASITVAVPGAVGPVGFSNANMATTVQSWINSPSTAQGWWITSDRECAPTGSPPVCQTGQIQKFASRNNGGGVPTLTVTYSTCTTAANNACVTGQSNNFCNDNGGSNTPTTYSCTCNNAAYIANGGATACGDRNGCSPNHCSDGGDVGASVACIDAVAPAAGYSCTCDTGFSFNGTTCVSGCNGSTNPCGVGGTCAVSGGGGWTCSCTSGYQSTGGTTPTCSPINACTAGANTSCVTGQTGNTCVDEPPPSATYHCSCGNAAYTGTGTLSCTNKNECSPNHCSDGGDVGSSVACIDKPAPQTGYTCTCDAGFSFNGTTCVSSCSGSSNPCGVGGTCTVSGSGGWTCACTAGYVSTGGTSPSCVNVNACNAAANTACVTADGNTCVDEAPPSTTYHCNCGPAFVGTGTTSCTDKNECSPNHCSDGGDVGASVACHDQVAPTTGYTCTCDTGFSFNGTTCVSQCSGSSNPCGAGGACTASGTGGWTCACTAGFVSTGGTQPTCANLNACNSAAVANCTALAGNSCVDEAPPSVNYHCTCSNAATVVGVGANGKPACVNKDECVPNECRANGDSGALCADHPAPAIGYDCTCSNSFWSLSTGASGPTCVDRDECSGDTPCGNGSCINLPLGNGYTCTCDPGYRLSGAGAAPTCVHPDACTPEAQLACVSSQHGNGCVNDAPPQIGYTCSCGNSAYQLSADKQKCENKNECTINHCIDGDDGRASCTDHQPPVAGYDCTCSAGFKFDGTTCRDIDECVGGANPCGRGTCQNTNGSYQCICRNGFVPSTTQPAKCLPGNLPVTVTVDPGSGCSLAQNSGSAGGLPMLVLLLLIGIARRRRSLLE